MFWRPPCVLRTVIVNFKHDSDLAIRGVLWQSRGAWIVLRDPAVLRPNGPTTPVDGDLVVHRDAIAFLQALP
jgi:hypothetical protein